MIIGIGVLTFTNPEDVLTAMMTSGTNAVTLTISLLGVYALWLGILGIVEQTGLSALLASLLSPIIDFLFGKPDKETKDYLALNLSANILGLGNACTPMGIKAMQGLDRQNATNKATVPMIMLMVVNATSIQLLPTTVMGMRVAHGSTSASDIILPTLITTIVSTVIGIALVKLCAKLFKNKFHKEENLEREKYKRLAETTIQGKQASLKQKSTSTHREQQLNRLRWFSKKEKAVPQAIASKRHAL